MYAALAVAAIVLTLLAALLLRVRNRPELELWHLRAPRPEFKAADATPETTVEDYRAREARLFDHLGTILAELGDPRPNSFDRYRAGAESVGRDAEGVDWNRTFELTPDNPRGSVLLLHGLTDAPYSMRAIGEVLRATGLHVLGLRMPGHGTVPAALLSTRYRDWLAAARIGWRHVRNRAGDGPAYLGGYSTGAAIALELALDAAEDGIPAPAGLFFFSPAIGVHPLAAAANWHKAVSFLPIFRKLRWSEIEPEFDPYKYNSFPVNAGDQVHLLTKSNKQRTARLQAAGRADRLPPILAFQSLADATVEVEDVVTELFDLLPPNGSELVLFDVNRSGRLRGLIRDPHREMLDRLLTETGLPYDLTLVTNRDPETLEMVARSRRRGETGWRDRPLGVSWPDQIFSLSHVAIPFPPEDPLYGRDGQSHPFVRERLPLGRLEPRGEREVLRLPLPSLMRLRYNPFFDFMAERLRGAIAG